MANLLLINALSKHAVDQSNQNDITNLRLIL